MKKIFIKFILCIILSTTTMNIHAQNLIITNEGETIKAENLEIGQSSVFYTLFNDSTKDTKRIDKSNILVIKYKNGENIIMDNSKREIPIDKEQELVDSTYKISQEAIDLNQKNIDEINNSQIVYEGNKYKGKTASVYLMLLGIKKSSFINDGNLSVKIRPGYISKTEKRFLYHNEVTYGGQLGLTPYFITELKNNTDKTIYVDLANSFIIRNNTSTPYYSPSATSNVSSGTKGVGVNLGAITNAVGLGGAVNTLASGISVGGSKTSEEVKTTYSQRVIAIPPKSVYRTSPELFTAEGLKLSDYIICKKMPGFSGDCNNLFINSEALGFEELKIGESISFKETDNLLNLSTFVTYSFDETFRNTNKIRTEYYLKSILGSGRYKKALFFDVYIKYLNKNWSSVLFIPGIKE